jgi:hypothetical protein
VLAYLHRSKHLWCLISKHKATFDEIKAISCEAKSNADCHPFYLLLASSPSVTISNEGEIEGEEASKRQEIEGFASISYLFALKGQNCLLILPSISC